MTGHIHCAQVSASLEMEQSVNRGLTKMKTKGGLGLDNLVNQYDFFDWMSGVFLPRYQDLQGGGNDAFGSGNFLIGAPRLSQTFSSVL